MFGPRDEGPIRIAFVLFTNLSEGAGTEKTLLNYVRYMPPGRRHVIVVQTNQSRYKRLSEEVIRESLSSVSLRTVPVNDFGLFSINLRPLRYAYSILLRPIIAYLATRGPAKEELADLGTVDVLFFFSNDYSSLVRKRAQVFIGSTQTLLLNGPGARIGRALIRSNLMYRRIDGFQKVFKLEKWDFGRPLDFELPGGVDTSTFHPALHPYVGPFRFLFVSRLTQDKGFGRLLEAWEMCGRSDWELHIVGRGPMEGHIPNRPNVIYHGALPETELAEVYRSCDVFVFPTAGESFGLVVVEALASGLFVLAGDSLRGMFDQFEALGSLAYIPNSPERIAESMRNCAERVDTIRRPNPATRSLIKERFEWSEVSRSLFEALDQIAINRRQSVSSARGSSSAKLAK